MPDLKGGGAKVLGLTEPADPFGSFCFTALTLDVQ